jgi:predicted acylesterase/phospholipase RssA
MDVKLDEIRLGVALSGGGFRATVYGLGALLYLVDSGLNKQVTSISSVSGGSITNGYVAQSCNFQTVTTKEFEKIISDICTKIVNQGLITNGQIRAIKWMGAISALLIFLSCLEVCYRFTPLPIVIPIGLLLLTIIVAVSLWVFRGKFLEYRLRKVIFDGDDKKFDCFDKDGSVGIEHVFCAVDINHGSPVYISTHNSGQIYCDSHGWGSAKHIRMTEAIRSSAAFPGAFSPRRLSTKACNFQGSSVRHSSFPTNNSLYLVDGGVWNNLGTDWWDLSTNPASFIDRHFNPLSKYHPSKEIRDRHSTRVVQPNLVLVMHANMREYIHFPTRKLFIPVISEIVALYREMLSLYENSVSPRIKSLGFLERAALKDDSPFEISREPRVNIHLRNRKPIVPVICTLFQDYNWQQLYPEIRNFRLHEAREAFAEFRKDCWWQPKTRDDIPTTLDRLTKEVVVDLLVSGYVGAAGGLFVHLARLGHELPEKPCEKRFMSLF